MAQRESLMLRPKVVLAIAWRDLSALFRGRRGWVLPFIAAILLAPLAAAPIPGPPPGPSGRFAVSGDVPERVAALDEVGVVEGRGLRFEGGEDALIVHGAGVPPPIREALDGGQPTWSLEVVPAAPWPLPGRTLILALLAASILTGAVSESIPGERSRGTLEALLTAAVSRAEVVTGKWLAWAGFGAVAALSASVLVILFGRVPLGWWLIAIPTVPMGTVALGLFLVRRSRDVVGGATVSLRVLPAVLSILGVIAWFLGFAGEAWGAAVPLGGALVAAGNTWVGPVPPLVGAVVTLTGTALLLWATSRDLERPQRALVAPQLGAELWSAGWALGGWWIALGTAGVWVAAGNATVGLGLPVWPGLLAGTLALSAVLAVRVAHQSEPSVFLGWIRPKAGWWPAAVGMGLVLGAVLAWGPIAPITATPVLELLAERQALGLASLTTAPVVGLLVLVIQELAFRGWLQRALGPIGATAAFVLIISPLDPLRGLLIGAALAALTYGARSGGPAIVARIIAGVVAAGALWFAGG